MKVFADTSFFIAILHGKDRFHETARSALQRNHGDIFSSTWVIVEVCNFLSRRSLRPLASEFLEMLEVGAEIKVVDFDKQTFEMGKSLFAERFDKEWSLTDCISMSIMSLLSIIDVLTTDHHVVQAGFNALLITD